MKLFVSFLIYLIVGFANPAFAASGKVHLDPVDIDLSDKASLQRGAKTFMNYCLSCHSAAYMRYNRMGKDLGLTDAQVQESLMFASDKVGDTMTVAMRPEDAKKWFGVVPPDLSVISRARGTDWLYTYLRSYYLDINKPLGTNNLVF
jgi:ubiquinol-cytochrome c reductase cytochrome c1 subunit